MDSELGDVPTDAGLLTSPEAHCERNTCGKAVRIGVGTVVAVIMVGTIVTALSQCGRQNLRFSVGSGSHGDGLLELAELRDKKGRCVTPSKVALKAPLLMGKCKPSHELQSWTRMGNTFVWTPHKGVCLTMGERSGLGYPLILDKCEADRKDQDLSSMCLFAASKSMYSGAKVATCEFIKGVIEARKRAKQRKEEARKRHEAWLKAHPTPKPRPQPHPMAWSLFCWMVVLPNSAESELQYAAERRNAGIYACDGHKVYDGSPVGKDQWGWDKNAGVFKNIWGQIFREELYKHFDWTVKVDADTVFNAWRVRDHLKNLHPADGAKVYVKNTPISFQFLGPMEIISRGGVEALSHVYMNCGGSEGGEDGWIWSCSNQAGLTALEDFNMLNVDGLLDSCWKGEFASYHAFKNAGDWHTCMDRIQ